MKAVNMTSSLSKREKILRKPLSLRKRRPISLRRGALRPPCRRVALHQFQVASMPGSDEGLPPGVRFLSGGAS
jgi:hypothetical protein